MGIVKEERIGDGPMTLRGKPRLIATITSFEELHGYEAEAKARGLTGDEVTALAAKRKELAAK